jgi:hypothetical protein
VISRIKAFGMFWYDFVVGDDWRVALGVIGALAATYGVSKTSVPAWWIPPAAVAVLLSSTLVRATRKSRS